MSRRALLINLDFEDELIAEQMSRDYQARAFMRRRNAELSWIALAFTNPGDVLVSSDPSFKEPESWTSLCDRGLHRPQICFSVPENARLLPWGVSARARKLAASQIFPAPGVIGRCHSKAFAWELARELGCELPGAQALHSAPEFARHIESHFEGRRWIAKRAWSVAGRGVLKGRGEVLEQGHRNWLTRSLEQGPVIVQEWLSRDFDFSVVCHLDRSKQCHILALTEMLVQGTTYSGTYLGAFDEPDNKYNHWRRALEDTALRVGAALSREGYYGPFGIDALVSSEGKLYPLVEINARLTMGRVAFELKKRLGRGRRYGALVRLSKGAHCGLRLSSDMGWIDSDKRLALSELGGK
jgi:hypothetical protein